MRDALQSGEIGFGFALAQSLPGPCHAGSRSLRTSLWPHASLPVFKPPQVQSMLWENEAELSVLCLYLRFRASALLSAYWLLPCTETLVLPVTAPPPGHKIAQTSARQISWLPALQASSPESTLAQEVQPASLLGSHEAPSAATVEASVAAITEEMIRSDPELGEQMQ